MAHQLPVLPELSEGQRAQRALALARIARVRHRNSRRLALRVRLLHLGRPW